jgi:hypothetical protein
MKGRPKCFDGRQARRIFRQDDRYDLLPVDSFGRNSLARAYIPWRAGIFSGLCDYDVRYCADIVMLRNIAFYFFL